MLNDYVAMKWAQMRYEDMLRERKEEHKLHQIELPKRLKKAQPAEATAPAAETEQN